MRHKIRYRKLGRTPKHRRALFRNLATALITHERIRTTWHKAMELRPWIEKLIHKSMQGGYQGHKFIKQTLFTSQSMKKLSRELGPRYAEEGPAAGFTRVEKLGPRPNDRAMMARIELVNNPYQVWEERQEAQRADDLGKPSFWEWELKVLR